MKRSLEGTEGVKEVKVSYKEKKAWVRVDSTVTDEALIEAVTQFRYKARVLERINIEAGETR